jgi:hypothetical protein
MAEPAAPAPEAAQLESQRSKYLAYEHSVTVDSPEGGVKPLLDKLVAACQADLANQCTLLASGVEAAGSRAPISVFA